MRPLLQATAERLRVEQVRCRRRWSSACAPMASRPGQLRPARSGVKMSATCPIAFMAVDFARRRWTRCRRFPARDAAARTGPGTPGWRPPDGRRRQQRRILRGIYRGMRSSAIVKRVSSAPSQALRRAAISKSIKRLRRGCGSPRGLPIVTAGSQRFDAVLRRDAQHLVRRRPSRSAPATGLRGTAGIPAADRDIEIRAPRPRPPARTSDSASATASPPSLRSCADSARPSVDDLAHGRLHALLVIHVERRRQAPQTVRAPPWRTACRRSGSRRTRRGRRAESRARPGRLEVDRHRRCGLHQPDDAQHRRGEDRLRRASRCRG